MNPTDRISFAQPGAFWLLLLLPLIGWWYWNNYRTHYAPVRLSNLPAFAGISSWRGRGRSLLPVLRALACISLIIALARPQLALKTEDVQAEGIDIVLAMDISSSMLAQDFEPNRLEASKKVASDFIDRRAYDRFGLVIFSGEAYTQSPLTTDHAIVQEYLDSVQCGYLQDGTAIGMGLATAVNRLKNSEAKSRVIILLTDGVNNLGYIQPMQAADLAKNLNIKVYTIGVGTQGEALTPVQRANNGQYIYGYIPVEIDEELLQNIANMTGGKYFRATSLKSLESVYNEIDKLEKSKIDITAFKRYADLFGWFILASIILIISEILLRYSIFRTIP